MARRTSFLAAEGRHEKRGAQEKGLDRLRKLSWHLTRGACGKGPPQSRRYETRRLLRGERSAARRKVRFPPTSFDYIYDVGGTPVAGTEAERRVALFLCFITLQKAYDSVDCTPLWQMFTRFGVPPQMLAVIQQFHDGMRACVRSEDGKCLKWFEDRGYGKGLSFLHSCLTHFPLVLFIALQCSAKPWISSRV